MAYQCEKGNPVVQFSFLPRATETGLSCSHMDCLLRGYSGFLVTGRCEWGHKLHVHVIPKKKPRA